MRSLGYSPKWGVFTIGIAVALAEHGLDVSFHSDTDHEIQPLERRLYARARRLAIPIAPAARLSHVRREIARGSVPVVFYRAGEDGHFSPVAGIASRRILLPNDAAGALSIARFRRAWRQPGYPQQLVIARPPSARGALRSKLS